MSPVRFQTHAIRITETYLTNIEDEIKGVWLNHGIEPLHRMRIATRRLRSAFKVFENLFDGSEVKKWRMDVRLLGKALGQARELDVQIRFLKTLPIAEKNAPQRADIRKIQKLLEEKRKKEQQSVISALNILEKRKTLQRIRAYLASKQISIPQKNEALMARQAQHLIKKRLSIFLNYSRYVYRPEQSKKLHEMRIAAKKLRYTLEIVELLYKTELKRYGMAAKRFQDVLGQLHEFDVWLLSMPEFARNADISGNNSPAVLNQKFLALRRQAYKKFTKLWEKTESGRLWQKLRQEI